MYLFTVTQTFNITSRGLILLPGLGDHIVRVGSSIRLVRPDKTELFTKIKGITFEGTRDILIEEHISKNEVPIGTEVWLVENKHSETTPKQLVERLKLLKQRDKGRLIFGASTHRYRLNLALSDRQLMKFERRHSIQLPSDYRNFLQYAGDGGAGPAYGLLRLGE